MFFHNVGSYKSHTASHLRRRYYYVHFNSIFPSTPGVPKWCPPLQVFRLMLHMVVQSTSDVLRDIVVLFMCNTGQIIRFTTM
jgi:hypothetical protein